MARLLPLALLLSIPIVLSACGGGGKPSTVSQQVPAAGATVMLGDQVTLKIPPGALPDATKVTITQKNAPDAALAGGQSLGSGYNIDLGGQTLAKPVTLEIAFDPKKLPQGSPAETAFAAYHDDTKNTWVPVGGTVDTQRHVISIQTDHLSWWNPFSWNWGAWIAVLNNVLTGNVTDFLHAVNLLTTGCAQTAPTVSVDASRANNVVQGCVEHDDPSSPQLRVVNPKSFFYEVKPISGGNGYPPNTMLGPGDDLKFQASTSDPAPLVVQAEITQKAGLYLIVHLIIQMLPGLNELGIQGPQVACITERLADVSYFVSAAEALIVSHDGAAAAEQLIHFLNDGGAVRRFITAASDCNYGAAPTWSVEGIKQIGTATATIMSVTDFVANYLLNYQSEVRFTWLPQPTPTRAVAPTPTPGAAAAPSPMAAPTNVTCTWILSRFKAPIAYTLALRWTDNSQDESDFHIEFSRDGTTWSDLSFWPPVPALPGTGSTYENAGGQFGAADIDRSGIHYIRVRAHRHSDDLFSAYSSAATCTGGV